MHPDRIATLIALERARQVDVKGWTLAHDATHTTLEWTAILQHELGQLADVALHGFGPGDNGEWLAALTKIAAVAHAAMEHC